LAKGTWFYSYLVGLLGELREILEGGLQASKELKNEQSEIPFLRRLGELFEVQGQDEKALTEYLEKAEEIGRRYNDDIELGRIGNERSSILFKQKHVLEAEQFARRMLEIGERHNNLELKTLASSQLSRFASAKGQFDEALEWLERGEKWAKESGWTRGLAWLLYRRGTTLIQQGNAAVAERFLMQSLNMATSWSERRLIANDKLRCAQVYLETGQLQLALEMAKEAHNLCERLGMAVEVAEVEELLRTLSEKKDNG
jgi:tetratricopeptide (TPR) repeat protein